MSAPAPPKIPLNIVRNLAYGPLIAAMLGCIFYGTMLVQTFSYYQHFRKDFIWLKWLVFLVFLMESANTALNMVWAIDNSVTKFGNVKALDFQNDQAKGAVYLGFILAGIVNLFFIRRAFFLSQRNWVMAIVLSFFAIVRSGLGIASTTFSVFFNEWGAFKEHAHPYITAGLILGLVLDAVIALVIAFYLLKGRDGGFKQTQNVVDSLIKYTMNTGGILSLCNVAGLIAVYANPGALTFMIFIEIQSKLYANCFLASLNARRDLHKDGPISFATSGSTAVAPSRWQPDQSGVEVKTEVVMELGHYSGGYSSGKV